MKTSAHNPYLNGHPEKLLTNYQLGNWHAWLDRNVERQPVGAMDGALRLRPGTRQSPALSDLAPGGRHDYLRGRMARDEAPEAKPARNPMAIMRALAKKCTPEEWADLHGMLRGAGGEEDPDQADDDMPENATQKPRVEAMDSARRLAFDAMFPNAGKVRSVDTYGQQPKRPPAPTQAGVDSFNAMFPGASRIKRG
ncbi:hypothetical protein [Labrys monachus]|uniref:Uncharacterized protein n=1 Tax=Labrys monachus TaxID=217067 RepID=A0ABU0FKQ3_9HYPH|nr:hypothetical protein [Labrys monachus]MDQ0395186.1 hypothetical protein [Labrys monachus]